MASRRRGVGSDWRDSPRQVHHGNRVPPMREVRGEEHREGRVVRLRRVRGRVAGGVELRVTHWCRPNPPKVEPGPWPSRHLWEVMPGDARKESPVALPRTQKNRTVKEYPGILSAHDLLA